MTRRRSRHARPEIRSKESNAPGCARVSSTSRREQRLLPTARSQRSRLNRKPLKTVAPDRVHTTTLSDLLANRWQTVVRVAPCIRQAGYWTRPELLVWGGAPRRNRTGDPILTIDARRVHNAVHPLTSPHIAAGG